MRLSGLACLAALLAPLHAQSPARWIPQQNTSWQWQLTGAVDLSVDAEMYDIDLFDNEASVVAALHARGRKAVCYVSVGTFEPWRPDAARFPEAIKGRALADFPDERWLDIRRWDLLGPIMEARFDMCRAKGFDAVEPDNVDAYTNRSGFPLSGQDQINYNRRIAEAAHARGLSVGLKNDLDQIPELLPYFDWALNEQCFQYRECEALGAFVRAGKAVFTVEYEIRPEAFCSQANAMNFNSLHKNYDLDVYRVACRAAAPAPQTPRITAVVNAASYRSGPVSPGEIVAVFGSGLGPAAGMPAPLADGIFPSRIEQCSITFDDQPAPLLYTGDSQILAVVPYGIAGRTRSQVALINGTLRSAAFEVEVAPASPGIFTADASGRGPAAALNQDGSFNTSAGGALPGSVVTLFATGEGLMTPLPRDGSLAETPLAQPVQPIAASIGGQTAEVIYAGAAPGLVAGLLQLNIRVPAGARGPAAAVEVRAGEAATQPGVHLFIAGQ
jgi:uncharacterized protein (TIGR03437 family)